MDIRLAGRWIGLGLGLLALGPIGMRGPCRAQTGALQVPAERADPLEKAIVSTLRTGRPILMVVTSRGQAEPRELWYAMLESPRARVLGSRVEFVELTVEDAPTRVRQLAVSATPTLCVLRRGRDGVEKLLEQAMPRDLGGLVEWADWTARLNPSPPRSAVDPALSRTGYSAAPSIQATPQASQAPPQAFAAVPIVTTPTPSPVALSLSSPPIYVQPAAPTVVLGPTPPANVFVTQASPAMPVAPSSPIASAQSPAQPILAAAQVQPALGLMQAPPAAAAVPQATQGIGLVLCNPNPIDRLIGAIGRYLAQRGLPRLQLNSAAPATFAPTLVPMSQAGMPLTLAQPQQLQSNAQVPSASPQQVQPPVTPSPQGGHGPGEASSAQGATPSLWSRLFHKN